MKVVLKFKEKLTDEEFHTEILQMGFNISLEEPDTDNQYDNFYVRRCAHGKIIGTANSSISYNEIDKTITVEGARHSLHFSEMQKYFCSLMSRNTQLITVEYHTATPSAAWYDVDVAPTIEDLVIKNYQVLEAKKAVEKLQQEYAGMLYQHNLERLRQAFGGDIFVFYDDYDNPIENNNQDVIYISLLSIRYEYEEKLHEELSDIEIGIIFQNIKLSLEEKYSGKLHAVCFDKLQEAKKHKSETEALVELIGY